MFPLVYYNAAGAMYAYLFGKLAVAGTYTHHTALQFVALLNTGCVGHAEMVANLCCIYCSSSKYHSDSVWLLSGEIVA